jgi:hypothetical protein
MIRLRQLVSFLPLAAAAVACSDTPTESGTRPIRGADGAQLTQERAFAQSPFLGSVANRFVPAPGDCNDRNRRAFDFWLGKWSIDGGASGVDAITSEVGGCVLFENFSFPGGGGRSMNAWDAANQRWVETWTNIFGGVARLSGGIVGGKMFMWDSLRTTPAGVQTIGNLEWTPNADGSVRQIAMRSVDGGLTFTTTFSGLYVRDTAIQPAPRGASNVCTQLVPNARTADFILGQWRVESASGAPIGTLGVDSNLRDCLLEAFVRAPRSPRAYVGRSFILYDRFVQRWYMFYADNAGDFQQLSGPATAGALVLTGVRRSPHGDVQLRMSWTALTTNELLQVWDTSSDGGLTWTETERLTYLRTR